jgi:tight adherence protein C
LLSISGRQAAILQEGLPAMEPILIPLFGMGAMFFYLLGLRSFVVRPDIKPLLSRYAMATQATSSPASRAGEIRLRRYLRWLASIFAPLQTLITPADVEAKLVYADNPYGLDRDQVFGLQILSGVLASILGFGLGIFVAEVRGAILSAVVFAVAGVALPILWLEREASNRQDEIRAAVPDSIELLAACVEAGLGFDDALEHVAARMQGPLRDEYRRFLHELKLGLPRQECYRHVLGRNRAEELRVVINALSQGHELGVPIGETLRDQAEAMRVRRLQRAKEVGAKASPKIAIVTTAILGPSILCLFMAIFLFNLVKDLWPILSEFARP